MFLEEKDRLIFRYDAEQVWIQPWGHNALRIRATKQSTMPTEDWALLEPQTSTPTITIGKDEASIANGKIKAVISHRGKIMIYNSAGSLLLERSEESRGG